MLFAASLSVSLRTEDCTEGAVNCCEYRDLVLGVRCFPICCGAAELDVGDSLLSITCLMMLLVKGFAHHTTVAPIWATYVWCRMFLPFLQGWFLYGVFFGICCRSFGGRVDVHELSRC